MREGQSKTTGQPDAGLPELMPELMKEIIACRACSRLVEYREFIGQKKRASYADWEYWARPVPSFGDPTAPLMALGLAPAAPRRQPHWQGVYRRPVGTFLDHGHAPGRSGQPANLGTSGRRPGVARSLRVRCGALRPSRRPAHNWGAGRLPALPGARNAADAQPQSRHGPGTNRFPSGVTRPERVGATVAGCGAATSQIHARRGVPFRPLSASVAGLLSSQPSKHQHWPPVDGPTNRSTTASQGVKWPITWADPQITNATRRDIRPRCAATALPKTAPYNCLFGGGLASVGADDF